MRKNMWHVLILPMSILSSFFSAQTFSAGLIPQGNNAKIIIDLGYSHELRYYDSSGRVRLRSPAVGGASWCNDIHRPCKTPPGIYWIEQKFGPNHHSSRYPITCKKREVCGSTMPYFMRFSRKSFGIHGGRIPQSLANVSHGCIRIPREEARKLSEIILTGTTVTVLPY